jgi:anion-transporting  ArsA/GET3 family ATPase
MKDILVLGKVKSLDESRAADLIIVDAPAAGHAVSFLLSPRGLLDAVRVGPINKQASDVVALLSDPSRCQVVLVTLPEETPVSELIETAYAIEDRAGVALGPIVVNQCIPPLGLDGDVGADAALAGVALADGELDALTAAARFRADLSRRQDEQCARLGERLPLPQLRLPYFFTADIGPREVELLADELVLGVGTLA